MQLQFVPSIPWIAISLIAFHKLQQNYQADQVNLLEKKSLKSVIINQCIKISFSKTNAQLFLQTQ